MVDDKGGSDLDVFEGLEKKTTSTRPPSRTQSTPPPPPTGVPSARSVAANKRTLLGVAAPLPPPPASARASRVGPPAGPSRAPPPLPGRSNLPPVVAPAPRTSTSAPPAAAAAAGPGVQVSWDEDDETTHIFEEAGHKPAPRSGPTPAAGGRVLNNATLLGLPNPLAAGVPAPPSGPPVTMRPPPPPSSPAAMLARSSGYPAAGHGGLPPPPMTRPGLGSGFPSGVTPSPSSIRSPGVPRGMPPLPEPSAGTLLVPHARGLDQTAFVRPPRKRTGLWVFLGLTVVALGAGAIVFLGQPGQGRILVYVTDATGNPVSHADVSVDGTRRCESAPCTVDAVPGGSHEIKVLAPGFAAPVASTVTVEASKDISAKFSLQATSGGLKVDGHQPGVKLYIDDKEIGPLPQEVRDISLGDHTIKLAGSDRYQPLEKHVSVTADQSLDLGALAL
jgi:hypothetical protein